MLVGKLLGSYKLAMVDKDKLINTVGGHCIKPIPHKMFPSLHLGLSKTLNIIIKGKKNRFFKINLSERG